MMEVLRSREHLEYFRNFLTTKGEAKADAPLQFWLAVEDLKASAHNRKMFDHKLSKIKERFFSTQFSAEKCKAKNEITGTCDKRVLFSW
jgi:hypothetical protein